MNIVHLLLQFEGPYRWYVISAILVVLTAVVTRFIFNTLKWFFLLAAASIIIIAIIYYFTPFDLTQLLR